MKRCLGLVLSVATACAQSSGGDPGSSEADGAGGVDTSDAGASADAGGGDSSDADDGPAVDASSGDPTAADTSGPSDSSGEPPPSLVWRTLELTCPPLPGLGEYESVLVELATELPAMPSAHAFVPVFSGSYALNPSSGAESILDEGTHSLSLSCGNGNGLGTEPVRIALGYDPMQVDGVSLRWDVREVECPELEGLGTYEERDIELADGIDPAFVSAHYVSRSEDSTWWIKSGGGRGSTLRDDGTLVIRCGNGNAHAAGETIRVAFGYPEDARPDLPRLRWETYVGECPATPGLGEFEEVPTRIATGIDLDFVAGSYAYASDGQWHLNPLSGSGRVESGEQAAYVNCGNGNALSTDTTARIALAYLE